MITLDEAIKELEELAEDLKPFLLEKTVKACYLGVEALKRIKLWRQDNVYPDYTLLPGETEE
jgi:hypothetical protein